jgi:hypothetical protein
MLEGLREVRPPRMVSSKRLVSDKPTGSKVTLAMFKHHPVAEEKIQCMMAVELLVVMVDTFENDVEGEGEEDIPVILL